MLPFHSKHIYYVYVIYSEIHMYVYTSVYVYIYISQKWSKNLFLPLLSMLINLYRVKVGLVSSYFAKGFFVFFLY